MKVWATVNLLATVITFSLSAPALNSSTTTDRAVEEVKQAATLDFNFIKNDLQGLHQSYADFINTNYLTSKVKLSEAINQTYEEDMPKDTSGYDLLCLEGIYDDVQEMFEDLNIAVAVCANLSQSVTRVDRNEAQFQIIISSLGEFSKNLTNLINLCIQEFPQISWDRLQCVFDQVDIVINKFNPVFDQVNIFNIHLNGHLMLLGVETSFCYQEALRNLDKINRAILRDVDSCKSS